MNYQTRAKTEKFRHSIKKKFNLEKSRPEKPLQNRPNTPGGVERWPVERVNEQGNEARFIFEEIASPCLIVEKIAESVC